MTTKLQPQEGATYRYNHDLMWRADALREGEDREVEGVELMKRVTDLRLVDGMFYFNCEGREWSCFYGWVFVLDTPENLQQLAVAEETRKAANAMQAAWIRENRKVNTLHVEEKAE